MSTQVLKPGFLVSLHVRREGGVQYTRVDLDADKVAGDSATVERWETTKVVEDPEEHSRAVKVQGKCSSIVRSVCMHSAFGLLCPTAREKSLDEAITEARAMADAFNSNASTARVTVYALKARIAESDDEAARAIAGELRDLMDTMKAGIEDADVTRIRDAANKAKKLGGMLDASVGEKISAAIDEARSAAREITKKLASKAEDTAEFVQSIKLKALDEARFAFLDLEAPTEVAAMPAPVKALDVEDDEPVAPNSNDSDDNANDPSNDLKMVASSASVDKYDL